MPEPTIPTTQLSLLIAAIVALAGVIAYLFRFYSNRLKDIGDAQKLRDDEHAKERAQWAVERSQWAVERSSAAMVRETTDAKIRAEFEEKHRVIVAEQVKMMAELHEQAREHENTARREFAQNMETVATKAGEASDRIAAVLDKFYDRFVGPRPPRRGT